MGPKEPKLNNSDIYNTISVPWVDPGFIPIDKSKPEVREITDVDNSYTGADTNADPSLECLVPLLADSVSVEQVVPVDEEG